MQCWGGGGLQEEEGKLSINDNYVFSIYNYVHLCIFDIIQSRLGPVSTKRVTTGWESTFVMPDISRKAEALLAEGKVASGPRCEVIQAVAFAVWNHTHQPTPLQYTEICMKIVEKYPSLKDTIGTVYVSVLCLVILNTAMRVIIYHNQFLLYALYNVVHLKGSVKQQLRNKMKNMRRPLTSSKQKKRANEDCDEDDNPPPKQPRACNEDEEAEQSAGDRDYMLKLNDELRKKSPRAKKIKRLMKKTFAERQRWIRTDRPGVSEVLDVFPPLKKSKGVS